MDQSNIHPIELTVQSIIESPLENLNIQLQRVTDSQFLLISILKNYELKLKKYNDLLSTNNDTKEMIKNYEKRINDIKLKLLEISLKLKSVNESIEKNLSSK
ncbi:hypothetical protein PACTADRAFT_1863 [Pachysolen tannophilus NRRL Y-2460]|uniref:Uncharacterized protein n=1 Tax=Pachysolen tannophilus NRRL Y-2460 TaxID=669874 RepID=A0A1E4TZY9_PACTA|nr:hypothetical protein PACTADRAFT_1863 [Pachysolen tannophilus NRRL Y-2460]